jgi:hypothetical protein
MDVEVELLLQRVPDAITRFELREYELELVEQARTKRHVLRPHDLLIVMGKEVSQTQMLADREIQVLRIDLEEAVGMILFLVAAKAFRQIGPDAIPIEHCAELFLERTHHGERRLPDDLSVLTVDQCEVIEARQEGRGNLRAIERL